MGCRNQSNKRASLVYEMFWPVYETETMKQKQVFRLFLLPFDNYLFYRHTQSSLRSKRFCAV